MNILGYLDKKVYHWIPNKEYNIRHKGMLFFIKKFARTVNKDENIFTLHPCEADEALLILADNNEIDFSDDVELIMGKILDEILKTIN